MSVRKQQVELTPEQKMAVLEQIDAKVRYADIAKNYNISKAVITKIKQSREAITESFLKTQQTGRTVKRVVVDKFSVINALVISFILLCRGKNLPVSGPMIQAKGKFFADALGFSEFAASNGWLTGLMVREGFNLKKLCGESADVNKTTVDSWKNSLPSRLEGYAMKDVFNCDETGFFFKQLPTKTYGNAADSCKGGKLAKERLSVLLCCSATGEKLKPLVIGHAAYPRCFKANGIKRDISNLPVYWYHNKSAWMTIEIFTSWLNLLNKRMKLQKRKILLFMDNCPSHEEVTLSNVTMVFLPPNTTSELQPLDLGIIYAVKLYYRKLQMEFFISVLDVCNSSAEFCKSIDVYLAIKWIVAAWNQVRVTTIEKCYGHCGFFEENYEDEDDLPLSRLVVGIDRLPKEIAVDNVEFDRGVPPYDEASLTTVDEAANYVLSNYESKKVVEIGDTRETSDEEEDVEEDVELTTFVEATRAVGVLEKYSNENCLELSDVLFDVESKLRASRSKTQTKITDYFSNLTI